MIDLAAEWSRWTTMTKYWSSQGNRLVRPDTPGQRPAIPMMNSRRIHSNHGAPGIYSISTKSSKTRKRSRLQLSCYGY